MERVSRIGKLSLATPAPLPRRLTWPVALALATIFLYTFGELAGDVRTGEGFAFDQAVMGAIQHLMSPCLTTVMRLITGSGSAPMIVTLALGVGVYWWRRAERRAEVGILFVTLAGSAALGQGLKLFFARPRPQLFPWLTTAGGWGFPSGHTLNAVVLGGLLAWLIGQRLRDWQRAIPWVVAGLWIGLVGLSRVYLGVHYPSDVLASLVVGGLCLLVALYAQRTATSQPAA